MSPRLFWTGVTRIITVRQGVITNWQRIAKVSSMCHYGSSRMLPNWWSGVIRPLNRDSGQYISVQPRHTTCLILIFQATIGYSMAISQISQSSCISGKWMVACLQSFPSQTHLATHVVRPPWSTPLSVHVVYSPAAGQSGDFLSRTITTKWTLVHTRPRPVILTVNDAFSWSGTCVWTTTPGNQHMFRGGGLQLLEAAE